MKRIYSTLTFLFLISLLLTAQDNFYQRLSDAAIELTKYKVVYDPAYVRIAYPNGDVAADRGVCTDVVVRAYRKLGIDLQKEVHVDMKANFSKYPSQKRWGMKSTDTNIDHRRVPNLQAFFTRKGTALAISDLAADYLPGDVVTWDLGNNLVHIGIVTHRRTSDDARPMIVHNIGGGQVAEDILFRFKITGHYRYKQ